jgi:hypothetical protein
MIITALWAHQPGQFFNLCTKSASGKWTEHFFKKGKWRDVDRFIKDNDDKDIYFCPHGFTEQRRKKFAAALPNMLWSDMDEVDPRQCKPKPTIAFESSPGRYVGLWLLDKPATEQLNKRLTYHIGADAGGWDVTQVLRVPGTLNYKYQSTPKVRVLWDDGPTYKRSSLENKLPELEEDTEETQETEAYKLIKDYERVLPGPVRRDLLATKLPPNTDRSKVIWKLNHALRDAGMNSDEIFIVLKASVWNKWRGRDVENKRLREEIAKVLGSKIKAKPGEEDDDDEDDARTDHVYLSQSLDEVEEENIDWIWYPYLARGEVTIVEGDPGIGKSYLVQIVAKHICDGERLPSPKKLPVCQGKIAYFDVENSRATVTKKRLKYNDIECPENFFQEEEPFTIDDIKVMKRVHQALEKLRPVMVVFDTVNLYIGGADTGKGSETTQAMANFKDIARRYNCAVVVLRHLTKGSSKEKALYRGQGNIAFAGVARIVLSVGQMPDDPETKVLGMTKINLAPHAKALTFTVSALPDTMKEMDRSRFEWGDYVDISTDAILSAGGEKTNAVEDAAEWLAATLEDEEDEVPASKIMTMAEAKSITPTTLNRACSKLGVKKKKSGFGAKAQWLWSLPKGFTRKKKETRH